MVAGQLHKMRIIKLITRVAIITLSLCYIMLHIYIGIFWFIIKSKCLCFVDNVFFFQLLTISATDTIVNNHTNFEYIACGHAR